MSQHSEQHEPNALRTTNYAASIAGGGLLLMAILGGVAILGGLDQLIDQSNAESTFMNLTAEPQRFRLSTCGVLAIAILDIIVAVALWAYFKASFPRLAAFSSGIRAVYALIFLTAIYQLFEIWPQLSLLNSRPDGADNVFENATQFYQIWQVGLGVFGLHLLLLGILVVRAPYTPSLIGALLVISGGGYMIDAFDHIVLRGALPSVSAATFVGEVIFMLWLLIRGDQIQGSVRTTKCAHRA